MELSKDTHETLETLIDQASVKDVLQAIAFIIETKAEHIAANWQDEQTANVWLTEAHHLEQFAQKCSS